MTYRDLELPQEIYDLIKIRCQEQGGHFDIDADSINGKAYNGFNWDLTVEGSDFWNDVLNYNTQSNKIQRILNFEKKYPLTKIELISEEPTIYKANYKGKKYEITIKEIKDGNIS